MTTPFPPLRLTLVSLLLALPAAHAAEKNPKAKPKPWRAVAGKADVMKHVPKKFAALRAIDAKSHSVKIQVEGESEAKEWSLLPDAEIKIHGWWGRLDQLQPADRVWVWFAIDREKKPRAILMIADEFSEQDIHDEAPAIKATENGKLILHVPDEKRVPVRTLALPADYAGPATTGDSLYVQSNGQTIRQAVTPKNFEKLRAKQQEWLRERWRKTGLPGAVTALHPIGGEMEVLLDHEAIRWGRYLKHGDKVTLHADHDRAISGTVNSVHPWRERTRVRLVTSGLEQLDLASGQRIHLTVPEPPAEVQQSTLPPDIGRLTDKDARIEWFLNTGYCSCGIQGDKCTGMFYTQASCNLNACGMPRILAGDIAEMIDQGKNDREIFAALVKEKGRDFWQPHLLR